MSVTENDLKNQLENLDWGVPTPSAAPEPQGLMDSDGIPAAADDPLDIDVGVPGVQPRKAPRRASTRAPRVRRQPNAQALLDAAKGGQTVDANVPASSGRRGRNEAPEVLLAAGEGPAVIALFDTMWREVGSKLAKSIGRSKASRQDAAIGWYALLLAMRERDASK